VPCPLWPSLGLPRRYCDIAGVDYKEYLLQGDQAVYMAFIDWIAETSRQKGKQKSHRTYKNYWKWLSEYYALHSKRKMDLPKTWVEPF